MTKKEFLERFDNNDKFTSDEISWFVLENEIKRINGAKHRWQQEIKSIFEVNDRYFALEWMEGLSENQESSFENQPYEVIKRTKTIIDYVKKRKPNKK